jgi:hypothetical protein
MALDLHRVGDDAQGESEIAARAGEPAGPVVIATWPDTELLDLVGEVLPAALLAFELDRHLAGVEREDFSTLRSRTFEVKFPEARK